MRCNGPPEFLESLARYRKLKAEGKWKPRIEFRYHDPQKRKQLTYKESEYNLIDLSGKDSTD